MLSPLLLLLLLLLSSLLLLPCPQAELDLYFKSGQLVRFLQAWRGTSHSLAGRYEELMVQLYERGYVGEQVSRPCRPQSVTFALK
jgi:hypothetical protein